MKIYPLRTVEAFSLINMLASVSLIAIIASIGISVVSNSSKAAKRTKLQAQVETLNSATALYLGSGGTFDGVSSTDAVFNKLKTIASNGEKLPGYRGSFIDGRLTPEWQTIEEANTNGNLRILWNSSENAFILADSGARGIKDLRFNEEALEPTTAEERSTTWAFSVNDNVGSWVWDHDRDTVDNTTQSLLAPDSEDSSDTLPSSSTTSAQLLPPQIYPASGTYPIDQFDLTVELTNPNPEGSSYLYVTVNGSNYQLYEEPLQLSPGSSIAAFSYPLNEGYKASLARAEIYQSTGELLLPPVFSMASSDCCESEYAKTLVLTNPNESGTSVIYYSINGAEAAIYSEPISIPGNTEISAYCDSESPDVYQSEVETHFFKSIPETQLTPPIVTPDGGVFEGSVLVTLAPGEDAPEGSRVFYTTDGTDPEIDENGEPINGVLYSEPISLSYDKLPGNPGNYLVDWDSSLWNDGQGWLNDEWDITQSFSNIGGSGIDLNVSLHGGPPTGDVLGPNLSEFSKLGMETHLQSTGGDLPDFYYSLSFSSAISLDTFATGGLFTYFDEMLANRIDLFDANGDQISLTTDYVTSFDNARLDIDESGIETVGTSVMNDPILDSERSTTFYNFQGLGISEIRWWHYAYEHQSPETVNGTDEAIPGAQTVTVGNDSVTFGGVLYDYPEEGTSTWFYIVESGEQPEISHVTYDISDETNIVGGVDGAGTWSGTFPHVNLNSGGGQPDIGYDRKTAAWGLKYDEGFSAYQVRRFYFTVDGNYKRDAISVFTKAGNGADQAPITGPGLDLNLQQSITDFTLIDADTDQPVPGFESLENGVVLDLAFLPTNFTIRANTDPTVVGSVRFDLDGESAFKVENHLPYCLMGDASGDYAPWNPTIGSHNLTATPFTEASLAGAAGMPGMIQFSVINTAEKIGHGKSSFLSDIAFHVDGSFEVVARVFPPSGDRQCRLPSEAVRKVFELDEPETATIASAE